MFIGLRRSLADVWNQIAMAAPASATEQRIVVVALRHRREVPDASPGTGGINKRKATRMTTAAMVPASVIRCREYHQRAEVEHFL